MKPAFYHYVLARAGIISILIGIIGTTGLLLFILQDEKALFSEWPGIGWIIFFAILIAGIGYIIGVVLIWGMLLGIIAAKFQGWPFEVGDEVVILAGKHKGKVTKVYEVWEPRGQVRLELGDEAKRSVTDVLCAVAVTRTDNTEQEAGGSRDNR